MLGRGPCDEVVSFGSTVTWASDFTLLGTHVCFLCECFDPEMCPVPLTSGSQLGVNLPPRTFGSIWQHF